MKYMLLIHTPDFTPDPDDPVTRQMMAAYAALTRELQAEGVWLGGRALEPPAMTTRVQVREGETLVVDGPLAETGEQIAGYYLVDCRDLDEATAVAARIPGAAIGTVEVRPVWDYEALLDGS